MFDGFYAWTVLREPGFPNRDLKKFQKDFIAQLINTKSKMFCHECKIIKVDPNTVHCSICGVCVEGYDHHCPWTSKCIGRANKLTFYCFYGSLIVLFSYMTFGAIYIQANY